MVVTARLGPNRLPSAAIIGTSHGSPLPRSTPRRPRRQSGLTPRTSLPEDWARSEFKQPAGLWRRVRATSFWSDAVLWSSTRPRRPCRRRQRTGEFRLHRAFWPSSRLRARPSDMRRWMWRTRTGCDACSRNTTRSAGRLSAASFTRRASSRNSQQRLSNCRTWLPRCVPKLLAPGRCTRRSRRHRSTSS